MKVFVFSTKPYDEDFLAAANDAVHDLAFLDVRLSRDTAALARGCDVVCAFVNDDLDSDVIAELAQAGVGMIARRHRSVSKGTRAVVWQRKWSMTLPAGCLAPWLHQTRKTG